MKNLFSFCIMLTFISCDSNTFSPIVELDIPPHTTRLVIRADWSAGSDSLAVFVSKSRGVLDSTKLNFSQSYFYLRGKDTVRYFVQQYDTVPNAKVELLRNGQLLGTIPYYDKGYHLAKGLFKLDTVVGTSYTIRVSAPNFETVEATQKVQNRFSILRGKYLANGALFKYPYDPLGSPEKGDALSVELQDNGNDENYYLLESNYFQRWSYDYRITVTRDTLNKKYVADTYVRHIDPNMEINFLSDRTFNGKTYLWQFWLEPEIEFYNWDNISTGLFQFQSKPKSGDKVTMRIRSVSKDFILFIKTLELAYEAQDNPFFTEPVILHSNVKNGYGIFSIGSVQTVSFVIP